MSKKTLFIGAIASIIAINSVFADTTVTSRNYVDTQVATKQNKIDATGANFTNGSVVETTSTPGVVTQRGIFNPDTDFDENMEVVSGHEGDLVPASMLNEITYLWQDVENLNHQMDNVPETDVANVSCYSYNGDECLLWRLSMKRVFGSGVNGCILDGAYCSANSSPCCNGYCENNRCVAGPQ